MLYLWFNQYTF